MMVIVANRFNNSDETLPQGRIKGTKTYTLGIRDPKTGQFGWPTFIVPPSRYPANVVKERGTEFLQGAIEPRTLLLKFVDEEKRRTTFIYDLSLIHI